MYLNLAWTHPVANTPLQANISFQKVASVAVDLFCDPAAATKAASAEARSDAAGASADEDASRRQAQHSTVEMILAGERLPWRIPGCVERGFEIPIGLTVPHAVPQLGEFVRLGMDVVVNAVWLAYYWAKIEENEEAVSALKVLILDWPMDFVLIEGTTPEGVEKKNPLGCKLVS